MRLTSISLCGLIVLLASSVVLAQDKTERVRRFEQSADQLKAIYRVHLPAQDFAAMADAAQVIATWGGEMLSYFPPDSDSPQDRAKPNIWEEFALFEVLAKDMEQAAQNLVTLAQAQNGADLKDALDHLGKRCSTCHKRFRTKD